MAGSEQLWLWAEKTLLSTPKRCRRQMDVRALLGVWESMSFVLPERFDRLSFASSPAATALTTSLGDSSPHLRSM